MNLRDDILYTTGKTRSGKPLVGGLWKLYEQEGFPLELSKLECERNGRVPDWVDAMADASAANNGPALLKQLESFLTGVQLQAMKIAYLHALSVHGTNAEILKRRQSGK